MPKLPKQQPFHEPIGISPEETSTSPVWIVSLLLAILILAVAVIVWLRATGRI